MSFRVEPPAAKSTVPFRSFCQTFEQQAVRTPDAVAVESVDRSLTYVDLDRSANRLARLLRRRGVGPDVLVAICMERSPELMVALLGVLKAGGAYLPLDLAHPAERIAFLFEDSEARLLLTDSPPAARLPSIRPSKVALDAQMSSLEGESAKSPEWPILPDTLAYAIYTSGSTGAPKGALIPHRALASFAPVAIETYGLTSADRVLQFSSIGFDLSVEEILPTWAAGATVVLRSQEMLGSARHFLEECGRRNVSVVNLPTAYWHQLALGVIQERLELPPALRLVVIGGERVLPELVAGWQNRFGRRVRLLNAYGPTETTVTATAFEVPSTWVGSEDVPIGRPIGGVEAVVLDELGGRVSAGVAGELYIGGPGVARGYLKRPELTAERFVERPPGLEGDSRLFRTGDRVRLRSDGELELLGRLDNQVKIRGYRVEPGEVEALLSGHALVREAVVTAAPAAHGGNHLVAYVIPARGGDETGGNGRPSLSRELRTFLEARLPEYMVPASFVAIESWPLTPAGKVDRLALRRPASERPDTGRPYAPPATAGALLPQDTLELVLLKIWERVLGVPVGGSDNFFELGGHSLLAVKLFSEIEREFGRSLPLATLFQAPTVETLAARLRQADWVPPWSSLVVIRGGRGRPPFFCVPGVGGNILGFYDLARELGPDQPVYGLQARGLDGTCEPLFRVEDMAAHYVEEIRSVLPGGPFLVGGASFGGAVAFEIARVLQERGEPPALVALFDTSAPGGERESVTDRVKKSASRISFHGRNLLLGREWLQYLRKTSRTLARRLRSRVWQAAYRSYRDRSRPLPPALRNVREAGYLAGKRYVPQPYAGAVTLFRAGVRSWGETGTGADLGWRRLARGGVEVREVPGDHVDMLRPPHVEALAVELRAAIDAALASVETGRPEPETASGR
ncbi:MAG: amino acid adenylation domain-containing protein [Acidobacteriota bacterium]